jgi:hypothetical protein
MRIFRPSALITGLLAACVAGCSSASANPVRIDPALTRAVDEYWDAVSLPEWGGESERPPQLEEGL